MIVGGGFSQPPITNTFQPGGGNVQANTPEQQPRPEQAQPAQAPPAEGQKVQDQRQQDRRAAQRQADESNAESRRAESSANDDRRERGRLVDVSA